MSEILDKMNWRYATKTYDPRQTVPANKLARILEAVRLAPSSSGLQPYEVFVVTNAEIREKMKATGYGQSQFTDGSHVLVFAAWDDVTPARVNLMFDLANEQRGTQNEGWEKYRQMLLGMTASLGPEVNFQHAARQAYIGLGVALTAAAFEAVDSTPMEGFDAQQVDELLQLREKGLRSVVVMALGYRQADTDWLVNLKKVRRPSERFITTVD